MASVVVTGASGFVGGHVAASLAASGMNVIGTRRLRANDGLVALDVGDRSAVQSFFRDMPAPDAVVHLAAIAHPRRHRVSAAEFDRVNHLGLRNVLDAAVGAGVRRVIFFSSSVVYGDHAGRGVTEDSPRNPVGPYACSKRDAEDKCLEAARSGANIVVLRFPMIYGPTFLDDLRARACVPGTGGRILLRVVGRQPAFSLCSVENAVEAVRYAMGSSVGPGVYNVADTEPYMQATVRDVIASIDGTRVILPVPSGVVSVSVRAVSPMLPSGVGEVLRGYFAKLFVGSTLDTTRVQRTGFKPRHRLEELVVPAHRSAAAGAAC